MIAYEVLKPIIDSTLHLSLAHISKDDVAVLKSTAFHGTAGLNVVEIKDGFLIEVPDAMTDLDVVYREVDRGLYTLLVTCMNINIKYLMLSTSGHELDIFSKFI